MELSQDFTNRGFSLVDVSETDLEDFIRIENLTHNKYVDEHKEFFGEYNENILVESFHLKRKMAYFQKLLWNGDTVGFFSYDETKDSLEKVFLRIMKEAQGKGLGTWFLEKLKKMADESSRPVLLVAIKTNPAQNLYKRLGFELYDAQDAFYFFRYIPHSKQAETFTFSTIR